VEAGKTAGTVGTPADMAADMSADDVADSTAVPHGAILGGHGAALDAAGPNAALAGMVAAQKCSRQEHN